MLREQEKQFHQHNFQEMAEKDKFTRLHQKELKVAAYQDLQKTYEQEQKVRLFELSLLLNLLHCDIGEISGFTESERVRQALF